MNNKEKDLKEAPRREGFWQFVKFLLVGVSNTIISEGVYVLLIFFNVNYVVASIFGFALSVLNAFYWSNKYVFKEDPEKKRTWWKVLMKTYVAYGLGYLINLGLLVIWVDVINLSGYMGPLAEIAMKLSEGFDADFLGQTIGELLSMLLTVPINFLINKKWAYK